MMIKIIELWFTPSEKIRAGWEEDFQRMAQNGDDTLLDADFLSHPLDEDEWEW